MPVLYNQRHWSVHHGSHVCTSCRTKTSGHWFYCRLSRIGDSEIYSRRRLVKDRANSLIQFAGLFIHRLHHRRENKTAIKADTALPRPYGEHGICTTLHFHLYHISRLRYMTRSAAPFFLHGPDETCIKSLVWIKTHILLEQTNYVPRVHASKQARKKNK